VKGLGKIAITNEHSISNVFFVESLGYNLLSVSQLCHMGYNCLFTNVDVSVFRRSDGSLAFKGVLDDKLYLVDFSKENVGLDACLIAKTNMGRLWHRRLEHVGMKNLHKLLKGDHVLGITDVCFEKDRPCAACQAGKQVGSTHHDKNVMTTSRPLELLHMDLFGPVAYLGKEWDSDCSSSDSDDEGLAASAFDKSSLFSNERHTCLMAKEKKVCIRDTPKYSSSSDEESSDDEVDYSELFKGLDRAKGEKINELIDALNEKDGLLEKQEDILYEEHDKFVSVQKSLALEIKRNEMLSSKLCACQESISSLKN
jgi:hypothetical protein